VPSARTSQLTRSANRLRQGYGGPPQLYAEPEAFTLQTPAARRSATSSGGRSRQLTVMACLILPWIAGSASAQPPGIARAEWTYGAFLDAAYLVDSNDPPNHLFRNRGTTPRVNELDVNMAAAWLKKVSDESSRLGLEVTVQTGEDAKNFGFSATAPTVGGADVLLHLGPTNLSYLAPVGKGLTLQGGIFNSLIGYDALYVKDNFAYTRPWGADYTPYFMLGVNASYPISPRVTATAAVVNGYWHLAHANDAPSVAGQLAYRPTEHITAKQTVLVGPHQSNTSLRFWRTLSDGILEYRRDRVVTALEYQLGKEVVDAAGTPRALWMSAQLPIHWIFQAGWSATLRPEFCWDRNGRWIGGEQSVKAITATLEYRLTRDASDAILRVEYRVDDSSGGGGGFFTRGQLPSRSVPLAPTQMLFGIAVVLAVASPFGR